MTRKEFLQKAGAGALFALSVGCFGACSKESTVAPISSGPIDYSLDLTDPTYSSLQDAGGYKIIDGKVVVAKASDGSYVAATRTCSHDAKNKIILRDNEFYCTDHGARFDLNGGGLNNLGRNNLAVYNTELNGNILRVFS